MSALGAQLQSNLQQRVFGVSGFQLPALPTGPSGLSSSRSEFYSSCQAQNCVA
jgi:hypothetical protein